MSFLFTNNAASTLNAGISASDTEITLPTGEGSLFASPAGVDRQAITLLDYAGYIEVCHVSGRAGDVLTIERAQDGTAARIWPAGTFAEARLTKGSMEGFPQTGAQIKTLYEAEVSAFTDALFSKLGTIEDNAKDDQTAAEILTALLTVDVDDSGLNANTLQGLVATAFALSGHAHSAFDRVSSVLSGATVFSDITITDGIVTAIATRALTPADIGALAVAATAADSLELGGDLANLFAKLADPAFTGNPTAPTQTAGNDTTRLATTEFVTAAVGAGGTTPKWTSPTPLGTALSISNTGNFVALCSIGSRGNLISPPEICFLDGTNDSLNSYSFDGDSFTLGQTLSVGIVENISLATLTYLAPAVSASDIVLAKASATNTLQTYTKATSSMTAKGTALSISGTGSDVAVARLNDTDIAYIDTGNDHLRLYRFNGTTWSQIGNSLTITNANYSVALAGMSDTEVALIDGNNSDLGFYSFDGTDWTLTGSVLALPTLGASSYVSITALNATDIAFFDANNDLMTTFRFDGSVWEQIGGHLSITAAAGLEIAAINGTDIVMHDATSDDLQAYRFGFSL